MTARNLSIKMKLMLLSTALCLITALTCTTGFVANDLRSMREASLARLQSVAEMLAFNSSAVVSFNESEAGLDLLKGLADQDDVLCAALYTSSGEMLAKYGDGELPEHLQQSGYQFDTNNDLEIYQPIVENDETIGVAFIRASQMAVRNQANAHIRLAVLVLCFSVGVALLVSGLLQRFISEPILGLAQTAKSITDDGDYSVRVDHESGGEIGTLYQAFNQMLQRIDETECQLRNANDELEDRVSLRTAELEDEVRNHKETALSLIEEKERAEEANRVKSEFLANMSHEIRTPMNAIIGFADVLGMDIQANNHEHSLEHITTIQASADHLLQLINDVLDISKIESGHLSIDEVECSPHQILAEVISIMRVEAAGKDLSLTYEWIDAIPEKVNADPARLKQILLNLIGNAIKFTPEGSVRVVAQMAGEFKSPRLKVDVIDTGIGIPAERLDEVFQPFVQADNSVTRVYGGTGLGLAICRQLAKQMGGTVTLTSEQGVGSCFSLDIGVKSFQGVRLIEVPESDVTGNEAPSGNVQTVAKSVANAHVLIVEDGEMNRRLIELILTRVGCKVTCAENGEIGCEYATNSQFDLILMDMQMPIMDGYTATRKLRAEGYKGPIVALTAHAMTGDREKCENAGCSDYVTKPIQRQALIDLLPVWLNGKAAAATEFNQDYVPHSSPILAVDLMSDPSLMPIPKQ